MSEERNEYELGGKDLWQVFSKTLNSSKRGYKGSSVRIMGKRTK